MLNFTAKNNNQIINLISTQKVENIFIDFPLLGTMYSSIYFQVSLSMYVFHLLPETCLFCFIYLGLS